MEAKQPRLLMKKKQGPVRGVTTKKPEKSATKEVEKVEVASCCSGCSGPKIDIPKSVEKVTAWLTKMEIDKQFCDASEMDFFDYLPMRGNKLVQFPSKEEIREEKPFWDLKDLFNIKGTDEFVPLDRICPTITPHQIYKIKKISLIIIKTI
ncbi:unnamed protein product [Caenorhabditis auriculariae]|uniref:Uncharacterized protein n=1 Tax=Caenorhabditis auriculariae TaxID=2777116 RepID=A0A8S1HQX0_9PELO|nr:unnamed protein product [Caenorhabditis auriculariae]